MNHANYPVNQYGQYHAHVYFEQSSLELAQQLCNKVAELFNLAIGRVHQKSVGPHTMWSCQITFTSSDFEQFIPWLDENRANLSVLVHALTGNNLKDHTDYAYWLGDEVDLNLSIFQQ